MLRLPMQLHDDALLSGDGRYRYWLSRAWSYAEGHCLFIGLNPSTADEQADDPTVRRLRGFAQDWGYAGLFLVNLYALRATDPEQLRKAADPVGPDNDAWLEAMCRQTAANSGRVVACWGAHPMAAARAKVLHDNLARRRVPVVCFGKTKEGQPRHPLYLPAAAPLERLWRWD